MTSTSVKPASSGRGRREAHHQLPLRQPPLGSAVPSQERRTWPSVSRSIVKELPERECETTCVGVAARVGLGLAGAGAHRNAGGVGRAAVVAVGLGEAGLDLGDHVARIGLRARVLSLGALAEEEGQRHRGEHADDHDHHEQLDEGEATLVAHPGHAPSIGRSAPEVDPYERRSGRRLLKRVEAGPRPASTSRAAAGSGRYQVRLVGQPPLDEPVAGIVQVRCRTPVVVSLVMMNVLLDFDVAVTT